MSAAEIALLCIFVSMVLCLALIPVMAWWDHRKEVRRDRRQQVQATAKQERESATERIQERRKWHPWVQMSAWDDAYQSISEQAGIECTKDCENRGRGRGGIITFYPYGCPLHGHRSRTRSPVYKHYRRYHLEDAQPVLDRLTITPPTYTDEGTLR